MKKSTDTPKTDEAARTYAVGNPLSATVTIDFARTLEREKSALEQTVAQLRRELEEAKTDVVSNLMAFRYAAKSQKDNWERLQTAQDERDDLRRQLAEAEAWKKDAQYECAIMSAITGRDNGETLTAAVDRVCRQLAKAQQQRDAAVAETNNYKLAYNDSAQHYEKARALLPGKYLGRNYVEALVMEVEALQRKIAEG